MGGGGGGANTFPKGFDPLPTQRVPLCIILRYPLWMNDLKIFLKAPLAPLYTSFDGGERAEKPKKWDFLVEIFQKVHKNAFLACFFLKKNACGAESLVNIGSL